MRFAGDELLQSNDDRVLLERAAYRMGGGELDIAAMVAISDELPVLLAYIELNGRIGFVNRPLAEFYEMPRQAIIGRRVEDFHPRPQRHSRAVAAALKGERVRFVEQIDHPSRGKLTGIVEYVPQRGAEGDVAGVIGLILDITEQRASEVAMRESEARFRKIADSAPAPIWVSRTDGSRDFVNHAFAEFFGVDRDDRGKFNWSKYLHPDDRERVITNSSMATKTLLPYSDVARYRRQDNEWRWLLTSSQPRVDEEGCILGSISVATDVTVAKEAELELRRLVDERTRELRDSEQRFRAIFDTVLEIIIMLRPDGTVVDSNFGTRAGVGKPVWDAPALAPFPDYQAVLREAVPIAAAGENFNREITLERQGLPPSTFDIAVHPVRNSTGQINYLLLEARDITDLKAAQEQLRQSQKMEALGQLTGGIAHDFNNLLTVVVGGLDLITKRIEDETLKRYATNALAAAERGAKLTAQLLAFSRVQRLEVRPTRIGPLVEHMQPLLRNVLGPTIDLRFDLGERSIAVMADVTQLELALLNLAINARDAMPDGGVLTVRKRIVELTGDPELGQGSFVELAVCDNGEGMPPEVQARAFEPFFTTKEVGKGTGLGLSMVYGVAHQSGGTVRIESAPKQGTTVKLYFRCADQGEDEAATGPSGDAPEASEGGAAHVLVIDDDPDVRSFIVNTLDEIGYSVRDAADGAAGLARFSEHRPDLVILDYAMPGMSGADVAERILEERPGQPILFVSGYRATEAIHRVCPDAPLLTKPFRADTLDGAVRSALGVRASV